MTASRCRSGAGRAPDLRLGAVRDGTCVLDLASGAAAGRRRRAVGNADKGALGGYDRDGAAAAPPPGRAAAAAVGAAVLVFRSLFQVPFRSPLVLGWPGPQGRKNAASSFRLCV